MRSYNVREFKGYPKPRSEETDGRRAAIRKMQLPVTEQRIADARYCPSCDNALANTGTKYIRDVIDTPNGKVCRTRWTVMRRYCKTCKVPKSAPIPGVLEGQKYGNDLMVKVSAMRCMGLPFDKIVDVFYMLYDLHIAKSTVTSLCGTVAKELKPICDGLRDEILQGDKIYCDETGWYLDSKHWWVWGLTTPNAVFYHLAPSRSNLVASALLEDYLGVIVSDSYAGWDRVGGSYQKCLLHYLRDLHNTLNQNDSQEYEKFFKKLRSILKGIISAHKAKLEGNLSDKTVRSLYRRITNLACGEYEDPDCKRFAKRLKKEGDHLLTCLLHDVDYHNNKSERALRPLALMRKVNYGSRSEIGLDTTETLLSIYHICRMRGINPYLFMRDCLNGKAVKIPTYAEPMVCTA